MLLLASASPARRRLLEQAQIPHQVRVSGVDEDQIQHPDPAQLVQLLAEAKALAVQRTLAQSAERNPLITAVLGCDSVLAFEGEVFGKPVDANEAVERWQRMRGRWAELHTGHCLLPASLALSKNGAAAEMQRTCVTTRVLFANLTDAEVKAYVASGEPLQCAGGFALEGRGGCCVEQLDGCYSNVIGLSLPLLRRWLALS
ncbi:nucleoside triphosphate pyrophosphatase [Synechococcus sp. UW179B]|uniref:Maf family protein n=1 Tax=Synechococcus sp. UW179B TaxID=2575516 RepID=UPI000E0E1C4F|nr:nucleoside triphosphate pyrophosphatase [Synechococcus sp. UW179B]